MQPGKTREMVALANNFTKRMWWLLITKRNIVELFSSVRGTATTNRCCCNAVCGRPRVVTPVYIHPLQTTSQHEMQLISQGDFLSQMLIRCSQQFSRDPDRKPAAFGAHKGSTAAEIPTMLKFEWNKSLCSSWVGKAHRFPCNITGRCHVPHSGFVQNARGIIRW